MNSINNLLNSNQYAAKTLWNVSLNNGNSISSTSSSASGLLGIIKNNMAQKANSKNSAQISALENKVNDLTTKLCKFDGYKSKLAQLSTTAGELTDLRSKIKINQTSSQLTTSNVTVSGSGIGLKNITGKLQDGVYGLKVSYANGSGPSSLISTSGAINDSNSGAITRENILNSKISEFKGYKTNSSGTESVTLTNGSKSTKIYVTSNTTVQDFLTSINNANIGVNASYDANSGKIKIESNGAVQFTTNGVQNANTLSVLKLDSISSQHQEKRSTLNIGRANTFGDVGYSGSVVNPTISINIPDATKYGDTINASIKRANVSNPNITFYEDKLVISDTNFGIAGLYSGYGASIEFRKDIYQNISGFNNTIFSHYDMKNISNITLNIDISKLNDKMNQCGTAEYKSLINSSTPTQTYKYTNDTTYKDVLIGLGIITQEDIDNNTTGSIAVDIMPEASSWTLISSELEHVISSYDVEIQAKTGTNAPATLSETAKPSGTDKLVNLISNKQKVSTGTFTISNADGSNEQTFTITNDTTFADFASFLTTNGVSLNEDGSYSANNKTFGGTSNLKNLFKTEITFSNIEYESILPEQTSSIEKNISAFGPDSDSSFSINGHSIDLKADESLNDLITKINQAQSDVVASFDQTTKQITLTSVDPLKKIDIIGNDTTSNEFLAALGFVKQNDTGDYETNGKSPVLNVELTKDGQVLSSQTVEANNSGNYTFSYEQTDESGKTASINFDLRNVGEFTFGVSNTKANLASSNQSVANILSHKGDLSPETYNITVKNKKQVVVSSNTNGTVTQNTLLSSLGFGTDDIKLGLFNAAPSINNARISINGNETIGDLLDKINSSSVAIEASIKDGEIVLKRTDGVDAAISIGSSSISGDQALENLGLYSIENTNSQQRIDAFSVDVTDSNGNTVSTNVFSDDNGKFFYTIEQEDTKSVTMELLSAGSTTLTISSSNEQISEAMNNVINSINSEIEVTNNKAIKDFVKTFNDVASQAGELLKLSSKTTSYSDKTAINSFIQKLNSTITQVGGKSGYDVGLSFTYNASTNTSSLNFDTEKFFSAIDEDSDGVSKYLSDLSNEIVSSIDSFINGSLNSISSASNSKINQYNDKISSLKSDNQKLASKLEANYKLIEQLFNQSSNQYSELFSALL